MVHPRGVEPVSYTHLPNGKILTFHVAAYDEAGLIGEGTHQHAIVDKARFEAKAQAKKG